MLPSLHDNRLVSYSVDCEGRTIKIRARRPNWPNQYDQDRFVVFTGVEGYHFENDAFGNIILSLERTSVDQLFAQVGPAIQESYRQAGSPGAWAADLNVAVGVLEDKQVQAFLLSSSYGLSGWILARDVLIERDTPVRSEIILRILPLMHDWRGGLDVQALVGDVISADSRLNIWFADLKGKEGSKLSNDKWLETLEALETAETQCKTAVDKFIQGDDRQELLNALREVVDKLNLRPELA